VRDFTEQSLTKSSFAFIPLATEYLLHKTSPSLFFSHSCIISEGTRIVPQPPSHKQQKVEPKFRQFEKLNFRTLQI
jgi:hypothetical protein